MSSEGTGKFNPQQHLTRLRGGRGGSGEYLEVKFRLVWLRSDHPDAQLETEHVTITESLAIFRARVTLPNGASATGYGSETAGDFRDFLEKAETKAVGRALAALGYGTQFAGEEYSEGGAVVDAPVAMLPEGREGLPQTYAPPKGSEQVQPLTDVPGRDRRAAPAASGYPHAQPPTENMVKFARSLQREVNLADEEFDVWCQELFSAPFADLNMAQVSTLINQLQRRKSARS